MNQRLLPFLLLGALSTAAFGDTLGFTAATHSVAENGVSLNVTVSRVGSGVGSASVIFTTTDGGALANSDYLPNSGTLTWSDGDTADKIIVLSLIDDQLVEGDEAFTVSLTNPVGATLDTSSTTVTVTDHEPGHISFTASTFSAAENTTATITASRSGGSDGAVSVDFATSSGTATSTDDYTDTSGTLSWADGEVGEKIFSVAVAQDDEIEESETVTLHLTNFSDPTTGNYQQATLNLINANIVVEFSADQFEAPEGEQWAWITVNRLGGGYGEVTVSYGASSDGSLAVADVDYVASSAAGTLTWPDGSTAQEVIYLEMIDDAVAEGDEPLVLTLTSPSGATLGTNTSTTLYIANDDADFSAPLDKIHPELSGVTQPDVIDLSADSPLATDSPMIDLVNQLDVAIDGRFNFSQEDTSGVLSSPVNNDSILSLHPLRIEAPLDDELPGLHLSDAGEVRIVTDGGIVVVCLPASADLESLHAAIVDVDLAEVVVTAHGDISVPVNAGAAPLEPNDSGELVIPRAWFQRYILRPSLSDQPADADAETGIVLRPHPSIAGIYQVVHRFETQDGDGLREQLLYPGLADWSAVADALALTGGFQRLVQGLDGTITAWIDGQGFRFIPAYLIERDAPPTTDQLEFVAQADLNGDDIDDLLLIYPNGDRQPLYRLLP